MLTNQLFRRLYLKKTPIGIVINAKDRIAILIYFSARLSEAKG